MAVIVDGVLYSDESQVPHRKLSLWWPLQAVIDLFWKVFGVVMLFLQGIFAPGSSSAYRPSSNRSRKGGGGWGGDNGGGPNGRGPRSVGRPQMGDMKGLEGIAKMRAMGASASAIHTGELKLSASESRKVVNIHLNRPSKLNALTLDQVSCINSWVGEWMLSDSPPTVVVTGEGQRAFCAGGDVARMADEGNSGWNLRWFATEFQMNHRIHTYPSNWVSLWNGIVMGGGVGLSLYGTHRIAAENTIFSMPETGIGFVPDIGASYFLSRLKSPGLGLYLGLTGARLNGVDLLKHGLATHYMDSYKMDQLRSDLMACEGEVDKVLDAACSVDLEDVHQDPLLSADTLQQIERFFGPGHHSSLMDIIAALEAQKDTNPFAEKCLNTLSRKCPTSCAVWYALHDKALREQSSLGDCLAREYLMGASITHVDNYNFKEGVRFTLFDKGKGMPPDYTPAKISKVDPEQVEDILAGYDKVEPVEF
ncbi:3-hydroxyisobutyryl-CoA hydrolase [Perkinsus olseni]|uniref:3-hydroxyisobutyryl-CoA hydrolase n=1 Tax=Perkinsus olseni TaxID=32597 RepID=A0A7J6M051_PEROL|nr:3-hydroxyisobutyryl-CoA hydrolase [Perkinsus olseni]KAF4670845.1 3-hydroxyisobutyryl-CoA hydrolase [Perkinsus olseni]